jgi:hypothetical protein
LKKDARGVSETKQKRIHAMLGNLFAVSLAFCAAFPADDITTLDQLCEQEPQRIARLFDALNLSYPGLEEVKDAVGANDLPRACEALLAYYKDAETSSWLRKDALPKKKGRHKAAADAIVRREFTNYTITATVPLREDGGLDWNYDGPNEDPEWGWGINRHFWAQKLIRAYLKTGNPVYAETYDRYVRDWLLFNDYPGKKTRGPWRGLETYMRVSNSLSIGFFALQDTPLLTPITRILILSSIPDHAHYGRNFHAKGGNWLAMEMNGLATAASCWPEFKEADAWFDYTMEKMLPEVRRQVYPDGAQKELTSHYHHVTRNNFDRFTTVAKRAGREIPDEFLQGIENMINYHAYSMRPSGYGVLNNDSDLVYNRDTILEEAERFDRQDWLYTATNGNKGKRPDGPPSAVFPWAGQLIMRENWNKDAHWAFFDFGPTGIAHIHYDKLHLSVSAHGRDILVDSGRYTYLGGAWRSYFKGSKSHNIILVDGAEQRDTQRESIEALDSNYEITDEFDFAKGTYGGEFDGIEGNAQHKRSVLYVRNKYWIILDTIETDRPREITALWHYHPDCAVGADGQSVASNDPDKGNIRIVPSETIQWDVDVVKGQETPEIQGWWSVKYNKKEPSPCAVYKAKIDGTVTFAWLMLPAKGETPMGRIRISGADENSVDATVTFEDGNTETHTLRR